MVPASGMPSEKELLALVESTKGQTCVQALGGRFRDLSLARGCLRTLARAWLGLELHCLGCIGLCSHTLSGGLPFLYWKASRTIPRKETYIAQTEKTVFGSCGRWCSSQVLCLVELRFELFPT